MQEFSSDALALLPSYALKIAVATLCGLVLGIERERKDKPAGLRTIVLITVGATLYMIVSELIPLVTEGTEAITRVDPSRIAAQVVTGIGFLGAGSIIQARGEVHGLTTAAIIWVAAGIGLCIGIGFPLLAMGITAFVLLVLVTMDPFRHWLSRRGRTQHIELYAPNDSLALRRLTLLLERHEIHADEIEVRPHSPDEVLVRVTYRDGGSAAPRMMEALASIEGIRGTRHFSPPA